MTTLTLSPITIGIQESRHRAMACRYVPTRVGRPGPKSPCGVRSARLLPAINLRSVVLFTGSPAAQRSAARSASQPLVHGSIDQSRGAADNRARGQRAASHGWHGWIGFMAGLPYPCDGKMYLLLRSVQCTTVLYMRWSLALRGPPLPFPCRACWALADAAVLSVSRQGQDQQSWLAVFGLVGRRRASNALLVTRPGWKISPGFVLCDDLDLVHFLHEWKWDSFSTEQGVKGNKNENGS